MRLRNKNFALACLTSLAILGPVSSHAGLWQNLCGVLYRPLSQKAAEPLPVRDVKDLEEILEGFTHGLEPDPSSKDQWAAFEIYRKMKFGDPNTSLNSGTWSEITQALQKHPELRKESFRNYRLETEERVYPVTPELKKFLSSQTQSSGQVRSNLFQIDANAGFWKKVLQYDGPKEDFTSFLDARLTPEERGKIAKNEGLVSDRVKILFHFLVKEREGLRSEEKDIRPISQAIVDLIHTIGFHDPSIVRDLKSTDGMVRLSAFRKAMDERDRFAMDLGFENHFEQVLNDYQVQMPTGVDSVKGLTERLKALEEGIVQNSRSSDAGATLRLVRHLSLVESPFRSCLGGSDCSSRTYLTRALDPNYHYFTLTDDSGYSSGQITLVLGEGKDASGQRAKMAFVDKVQNVQNSDLPAMMEGVRRSVAEKGYTLALPEDLGDHNGISNVDATRSFIGREIKTDPSRRLQEFKPHAHGYSFKNQHSRAEKKLVSRPVFPLSEEGALAATRLAPDSIDTAWRVKKIRLNELVQTSYQLKSGTASDHLRYIPAMKAIKVAGLKVDPEFDAVLLRWMSDPNEAFQVRKQALFYRWTEESKPLSGLLSSFGRNDQVQLLQNILDTPRLRDLVLKDKNGMPGLIVIARQSPKVRETLIASYIGGKRDGVEALIERVLEADDISDAAATGLVSQIKASLGAADSAEIGEFLKAEKLAHGTSIETWLKDGLLTAYASGFHGETSLGRALGKSLKSADLAVRDFGSQLLAKADDPRLAKFKVVKAFQEIAALQRLQNQGAKPLEFEQAALSWMRSEKVSPELKSSFLLTNFGSGSTSPKGVGEHGYEAYRAAIPRDQLPMVMKRIDETTNLGMFERLAVEEGTQGANAAFRALLENGKLESFEFKVHRFPEGGKRVRHGSPADEAGRSNDETQHEVTFTKSFEMQATPVTQLQWAWVMGENPSNFKSGGQTIKIKGRDVAMNPNRPVERVLWDDVQRFIQKLNELDPHYNYRLPTEDEWEYAARAGTDTAYSFGSDPNELGVHAWFSGNSGRQTHDVAGLKPNPSGLYDMYGNVSEWVHWSESGRPAHAVDYAGPASGLYRVLRGGNWHNSPPFLRSAMRHYGRPGFRDDGMGFRLVRIPKF